MRNTYSRFDFRALLLLGISGIAQATAAPLSESLDFALQFSRLDTSLSDERRSIKSSVKKIGIMSIDTSGQTLRPCLSLGYAYVSDNSQSLTAGMELQGFYIGPALRGVLIDTQRIRAMLTGTYLYQRVKDSNADHSVTLEWQQPQLDLDILWRATRQVEIFLGGQYGRVDADEKIRGTVNQTLTLHSGPTLGYRAGLEFDLGGDGQVGILLHRAIGDGVEIYFQRQF